MFFYLSKLLGAVAMPSGLIIMIGFLGVILGPTRFTRSGRRLVTVSVILFVLIGVLPVGSALMRPLEDRFPPWDTARATPDGIVILGGMIDPDISQARGATELTESAERLLVIGDLARRYPAARIVFTGGYGGLFPDHPSEAEFALPVLDSLGVARTRVLLEGRSRTTAENAANTVALVAPKPGERWLLVTSAMHMPRAIGAFRRAGFQVEAYPVDWHTTGQASDYLPSPFFLGGLARFDAAAHEWEGLLAYWLAGRSSELFPGP